MDRELKMYLCGRESVLLPLADFLPQAVGKLDCGSEALPADPGRLGKRISGFELARTRDHAAIAMAIRRDFRKPAWCQQGQDQNRFPQPRRFGARDFGFMSQPSAGRPRWGNIKREAQGFGATGKNNFLSGQLSQVF